MFLEGTNCWLWDGPEYKGYPCLNYRCSDTNKMKRRYITEYVCRMFWDFPDTWYVEHTCGTRNCVNPEHILPTKWHWKQR